MTADGTARDDRAHWESRYAERGDELDRAASPWVIDRALAVPGDALVIDIAGGTGRHAAPLAAAGKTVVVIDFVPRAVAAAVARHPRLRGVAADVSALPIRSGSAGAIICVSFLDRSIFGQLADLLAPGGILLYETFTVSHLDVVARGRARGPRNRAFLLDPGELPRLVRPLIVLEHSEGTVVDEVGERSIARVVARKA
jgi:SAM-dependent methyltransferase